MTNTNPKAGAALTRSKELRVSAGFTLKAGERIRTVDIHVGNARPQVTQSAVAHEVTSIAVGARSKYAARDGLRIKRICTFAVGEWPRDPDHVRAV